jgi:anti-sigma B factor antagonist
MIVRASGKLTLGEGTSLLRDQVEELAASGPRWILLNMTDVTYIDSAGIGTLVEARNTILKAGGEMKLLNLGKRAHQLLQITKLYTVFEVFEDEGAATASFSVAVQAPH